MATAQQQLDGFLQKYSPEMEKLGRAAFAHCANACPARSSWFTTTTIPSRSASGQTDKVSALPLSIALFPRWATLFFMMGATLDDPEGLLTGKGPKIRSIRLTDGMKTLKSRQSMR